MYKIPINTAGQQGYRVQQKLKQVISYIDGQKADALSLLALMFVVAILDSLNIAIIYPLIEIVMGEKTQGPLSEITSFLLQNVAQENKVFYVMITLCCLTTSKLLFKLYLYYSDIAFQTKLLSRWQSKLLDSYIYMSSAHYSKERHGEKINTIFNECHKALQGVSDFFQFFLKLFTVLAYVTVLLITSWKLTVLCFAIVIIFGLMLIKFTKEPVKKLGVQRLANDENLVSFVNETLSGIKVVKLFSLYEYTKNRASQFLLRYRQLTNKQVLLERSPVALGEFTVFITVSCAILYVNNEEGIKSFKTLTPILGVFAMTMKPLMTNVSELVSLRIGIFSRMPSLNIVHNNLNTAVDKVEDNSHKNDFNFNEVIKFKNVSFSFIEGKKVLNNINIEIPKRKFTAVVGPSGIGKSTTIDLLLNFFQPNQGSVYIDDQELSHIDINKWRNMLGVVTQNVFLFNMTVEDNIKIGLPNTSQEEIENACKLAHCHDFITNLPQGYKTLIGDRGVELSGGQKQRVSIARALLRDPEILVFDEATSALDSESERIIVDVIEDLSKQKTIFMVTHKLESIKNADNIYAFKKDGLVDKTTYDTLRS